MYFSLPQKFTYYCMKEFFGVFTPVFVVMMHCYKHLIWKIIDHKINVYCLNKGAHYRSIKFQSNDILLINLMF